ncbi:MAG: response regulator transcription factor [Candidatus Acidiferrales bacterium]
MTKKVLLADDNRAVRRMLADLFEAEEGYEICAEATDGHEAIALAITHRPDLIILDLSMPVVNGLEASFQLKKIMPDVPIILFTQHASLSNSLFGSGASVDRMVSKTNANELMEHVRSLVPV